MAPDIIKHKSKGQRKMFTPQEDALILYLINETGQKDWKEIAKRLGNRSARQVRERFRNYLSPGLTNGPWSREEDDKLRRLYSENGPKWSRISKYFNNRSVVNIKNRWKSFNNNIKCVLPPNSSNSSIISNKANISPVAQSHPCSTCLVNADNSFNVNIEAPIEWDFELFD